MAGAESRLWLLHASGRLPLKFGQRCVHQAGRYRQMQPSTRAASIALMKHMYKTSWSCALPHATEAHVAVYKVTSAADNTSGTLKRIPANVPRLASFSAATFARPADLCAEDFASGDDELSSTPVTACPALQLSDLLGTLPHEDMPGDCCYPQVPGIAW